MCTYGRGVNDAGPKCTKLIEWKLHGKRSSRDLVLTCWLQTAAANERNTYAFNAIENLEFDGSDAVRQHILFIFFSSPVSTACSFAYISATFHANFHQRQSGRFDGGMLVTYVEWAVSIIIIMYYDDVWCVRCTWLIPSRNNTKIMLFKQSECNMRAVRWWWWWWWW